MKIAYWIVTGIFCSLMLAAAAVEIVSFHQSVKLLYQLGFPDFIAYVLPVTKILGAIAILTRKSQTLTEWAYAGFTFDFILAALAHYFAQLESPLPAVIALILLMISYALGRKVYNYHDFSAPKASV